MSLHSQAEAYGSRPSEILGLETPWGAWQLDEVTLMTGRRVERNLNAGKDPFAGFLNMPQRRETNGKGTFRSVKGLKPIKKMKIPESGIW